MKTSRLELRSIPVIALAFVVGPVVGLSYLWVVQIVLPGSAAADPSRALAAWIAYIGLGGGLCLVVEAVVIAPILVGFHRYRWPWLNGGTAAAIGFAVGFAFWFLALALSTPAGWTLVTESLNPGVVGLIAAIVFRLMAVRRLDAGLRP